MANYAQIRNMDISNGKGIGVSIFFSGCEFYCENCFNHELWDYNYGSPITEEIIDKIILACSADYVTHFSILGGDSLMDKNLETTLHLVKRIKEEVGKPIWMWTGFVYEELDKKRLDLVNTYVDVLVDGRYIDSLYDFNLKYRGSKNQRVIDIKDTVKQSAIVTLYD